ncbi:MAG: hypothetical protein OXH98_17320 [Caldilineaceae bacterium]|nr:hypothetical protein [Caldilineaceae bacterium]
MSVQAPSRRQFLKSTTRIGATLTLAAALYPSARPVQAHNRTSFLQLSQADDIESGPGFLQWIASGVASLQVAGRVVNSFAHHLNYDNLPQNLRNYFRCAGGDCRGFTKGKGIWETIPEQIRMGGEKELRRFLSNKDWSHIVPKSEGGSSDPDNGIFELTEENRKRGGRRMTSEEIEAARKVIRSDMIKSVLRQTTTTMVKGGLAAVVLGALVLCLECGLLYVEGKISWKEMTDKIVKGSAMAGLSAFIVTGLIIGLNMLFPPLLPLLAPVLFVLQIVSLVFMAQYAVKIAQGWWEVLKKHDLVNEFVEVLEDVDDFLREMIDDTDDNILTAVWEWIEGLAERVGIDRAWQMALGFLQRIGIENAWNWFASRTQAVKQQASVLFDSLKAWSFPDLVIDQGEIGKVIANVIDIDFRDALDTTDRIQRSLQEYLGSAGRQSLAAI